MLQWVLDIYNITGSNNYILSDAGLENLGSLPKTLALLGCTSLTFTPHMSHQRGTAKRTIALLRQHIKKAYIHVRPKANNTTDYKVLLTIALQTSMTRTSRTCSLFQTPNLKQSKSALI